MKFVMTLAVLPSNVVADDQYQGLAWRVFLGDPSKSDNTDTKPSYGIGNDPRNWSILHIPALKIESSNKEDFMKMVTEIASKLYDRAEICEY